PPACGNAGQCDAPLRCHPQIRQGRAHRHDLSERKARDRGQQLMREDTVNTPPDIESAELVQIAPLPRVSIQAFCETPDVAQAVEQAAADRRMEKAHRRVQAGGAPAAVEAYRNAATPNVIISETDGGRGVLIDCLDRLSEVCDVGTK